MDATSLTTDSGQGGRSEEILRLPLSYPLSPKAPYPLGGQPVRITPVSRLDQGDVSNTCLVEFWNHVGTHVDGPAHMTKAAPLANFCPPTGLFLNSIVLNDIPCPDSKLIGPGDLNGVREKLPGCELLLLRTGFSPYRRSDPQRYSTRNPGINTAFARFIVATCPKLKCIGIDTISFAAMQHVDEGIEAHRILFRRDKPILLIEDINLAFDLAHLCRVIVMPLFIEGLDSCPCTVVAEVGR